MSIFKENTRSSIISASDFSNCKDATAHTFSSVVKSREANTMLFIAGKRMRSLLVFYVPNLIGGKNTRKMKSRNWLKYNFNRPGRPSRLYARLVTNSTWDFGEFKKYR